MLERQNLTDSDKGILWQYFMGSGNMCKWMVTSVTAASLKDTVSLPQMQHMGIPAIRILFVMFAVHWIAPISLANFAEICPFWDGIVFVINELQMDNGRVVFLQLCPETLGGNLILGSFPNYLPSPQSAKSHNTMYYSCNICPLTMINWKSYDWSNPNFCLRR